MHLCCGYGKDFIGFVTPHDGYVPGSATFFSASNGCWDQLRDDVHGQVFYGFMIQNVETWRPAVESCRTKCANAALTVASLLVETLAIQFPRLCSAVRDAISALIEQLAEEVSVR